MYLHSHFCHVCFGKGYRAWFYTWLPRFKHSWAGGWCHHLPDADSPALLPSRALQGKHPGKSAYESERVSTSLGTLLKPAGCLLLWILIKAFDSVLPSVRHWLSKYFLVTSAPQGLSVSHPRLKSAVCQHPLSYCTLHSLSDSGLM